MPGYFTKDRRRLASLLFLAAGLLLAYKFGTSGAPRDQEVRLVLAPEQQQARSVRLSYALEGEEITELIARYPDGAPGLVTHTPELAPGTYDLSIDLGYRDGRVEHVVKTLTVPSEEAIRVQLAPRPSAP
jgi:hypothetical protein